MKGQLARGEEIARCPSCSLILKVIYDKEDFKGLLEQEDEEEEEPQQQEETKDEAPKEEAVSA